MQNHLWCPNDPRGLGIGDDDDERRMEVTRDLYSLNLLVKLMALHRPVLPSLAIAALAEAILRRTSAEQVPSLYRIVPTCLKLVTSYNFRPFMLISALMLFVLLVMVLLFFRDDFHFIGRCSVSEFIGKALTFTIITTHKIHVVGKL